MGKMKMMVSTAKFATKRYSPEILLGVGIVGIVTSTVLACRATLKVETILDIYEETADAISITVAKGSDDYTPQDAKKN